MSFYYPLHRHKDIEEGKKIINFKFPYEDLYDERIHEWIGARYSVNSSRGYPDFDRIERQQILLKQLFKLNYSFIYSENNLKGMNEEVLTVLKTIDSTWLIEKLLCKNYKLQIINGMDILLNINP